MTTMADRLPNGGRLSALGVVGACLWTGRRKPLAGRLRAPVPAALCRFTHGDANWLDGVFPPDLARVKRAAEETVAWQARAPVEYRMMTEKAGVIWVRHWFSARGGRRDAHDPAALQGIVQIIDEQKTLEAECIRVCERERMTIGQELHDDLCQLLAGLAAMLGGLARKVQKTDPDTHQAIGELIALLGAGMDRARSLAHGLVLLRVVDFEVKFALGELAKECAARLNVSVAIRFGRHLPPHNPTQLIQLYRIMQEAIGNAVKHGRATRVAVRFRVQG